MSINRNIKDCPLILVVDDYEDIRTALKLWLEMRGCRVVEADNGTQAIEIALRDRPRLIILDLFMPQVDGFTTARRMREYKELREVPIIALSAHDTKDLQGAALAAGCNEYLNKPNDLSRLDVHLAPLLQGK